MVIRFNRGGPGGATIEFSPDWEVLQQQFGARQLWVSRLRRNVQQSLQKAARYVQGEIKKRIRSRQYARNAALTLVLKHGSTPLVETGSLLRNIRIIREPGSWNEIWIGVPRTAWILGHFDRVVDLHGGPQGDRPLIIPVTTRMRMMFTMLSWRYHGWDVTLTGRAAQLWDMNPGVHWYALSPQTTHIVVPRRPFIRNVYEDGRVRGNVHRLLHDAIRRSLHWRSQAGTVMQP